MKKTIVCLSCLLMLSLLMNAFLLDPVLSEEGKVYEKVSLLQSQDEKILILRNMSGKLKMIKVDEIKNATFYKVEEGKLVPLFEQKDIFGKFE